MFIKDYLHQIEFAAHNVFYQLGQGQKQITYKKALVTELNHQGLFISMTSELPIFQDDKLVKVFTPEIFIDETVIVQVVANPKLKPIEEDNFTNYLTLTKKELGYIVNFGLTIQVLRKFKRDRVI